MTDTDISAINREIAEILGWTCFGYHNGVTPAAYEPGNNVASKPVPDYCGDHCESLRLLEHCQSIRGISCGEVMDRVGGIKFTIYNDTRQVVEWSLWRGKHGYAEADTLPAAISQSCLAALVALVALQKGDETP